MSAPRMMSSEEFLTALKTSTQELAQLAEWGREVEMCFMARAPKYPQELAGVFQTMLDEYTSEKKPDIVETMKKMKDRQFPSDLNYAWRINYVLIDTGCQELREKAPEKFDKEQLDLRLYNFGFNLRGFKNTAFLKKYLARQINFCKNFKEHAEKQPEVKIHPEVESLKTLTDKYNDVMSGSHELVIAKIDKAFSEHKELNQDFADDLALSIFVGRDIFQEDFHTKGCTALHSIIVNYLENLHAKAVEYIERIKPKPEPIPEPVQTVIAQPAIAQPVIQQQQEEAKDHQKEIDKDKKSSEEGMSLCLTDQLSQVAEQDKLKAIPVVNKLQTVETKAEPPIPNKEKDSAPTPAPVVAVAPSSAITFHALQVSVGNGIKEVENPKEEKKKATTPSSAVKFFNPSKASLDDLFNLYCADEKAQTMVRDEIRNRASNNSDEVYKAFKRRMEKLTAEANSPGSKTFRENTLVTQKQLSTLMLEIPSICDQRKDYGKRQFGFLQSKKPLKELLQKDIQKIDRELEKQLVTIQRGKR